MNRSERSDGILTALRASGRVEVRDLAARFEVSKMTVPRDLEESELSPSSPCDPPAVLRPSSPTQIRTIPPCTALTDHGVELVTV